MGNTLFNITENKKAVFCQAEDFGEMIELLTLLHKVEKAKEVTPTLSKAGWLMSHLDKEHGLRPLCTHPKLALFKPISADIFAERYEEFQKKPCEMRHVVLDYDKDCFSFSEWEDDALSEISGTLSGVIHAYASSIRRLNSSQFYMNNSSFADGMAAACGSSDNTPKQECPTISTMQF